jgi:hypothetical protein
MSGAKQQIEQTAAAAGLTDYDMTLLHNGTDRAATALQRREEALNARTSAFVALASPPPGAPVSAARALQTTWAILLIDWNAFFGSVKQYAAAQARGAITRATGLPKTSLRGFGNFGGIIPYTVPGLPNGALEMGIGGLIGYLIGSRSNKGLIGALFGVAAGSVLGQMQPAVAGVTPTQLTGSGALVPATPGASAAGAAPDKANSGFDWKSAATVVGSVLTDKQLWATSKEIYGIIKQAWGADTKVPAEFLKDTSGYPAWSPDGSAAWTDGHISAGAGDWNVLDQSTLTSPPSVSDAEWSGTPSDVQDSIPAYAGFRG